ncbi:MAG: response regulator [bacterium]
MIDSTLKNANILIVDDQQANIDVLTGLLEVKGYINVKTTTDPRLVTGMFKEFKPDLILLDLAMPHLTGFQVMEQLKPLMPDGCYMPILVLTADVSPDAKRRALAGGAKDFLTKPFDLIEVDLRINNLLETRYLHQRLENQNQILEEKVKERTMELENAYRKLEQANQELQTLDKAKGEFLRLISHEIRTPLNGILGFTSLLRSELESPELLEFITHLENSAIRLEKFSYQALMITELRTKRRNITVNPVPLQDLVDHAHKQLFDKIQSKNMNILTHTDPSATTILCDRELLQTCFENLIDNAVKFSPPNNAIIVKTFSDDMHTVCEIIDKGTGFSPDSLKNPFALFGVGDKHVDQNTGLNLALTKLIMDAHQGGIEIKNNEAKGATVRLIFYNLLTS